MKINKDSTLVHKSLSTKMGAIDTIEVVANRVGTSYCSVNGVQVDITNSPGITALIFTENAAGGLDLTTRVRYNTIQNPQAGQPSTSMPVSLYTLLRGLANNQVFVIYTYNINTPPSSYDLTRSPETYTVNLFRSTIDINFLFAAIGSYKWNTIQRIANNGREYTPFCCIGRVVHGSHVGDQYSFRAQITHEALGNIRGQNQAAVLKVNIPKFFTKNTIDYGKYYDLNVIGNPDSGNTTIYGPIPPEKTIPTAVQVLSFAGVKVTMDVGYYSTGATYHGSTNNSEITINIVNASNTVLVTKKVYGYIPQKVTIDIPPNIRNANGDLRVVVKRDHSDGEVGLRSYVTNISYAKYAVAPNGTNEVRNVLVDKRVITVRSVNASNIGIDMVNTAHFNALKTVGDSTLYNYTTSRWLGNSTIPTFLINNTTNTYTSTVVDIDSSCNYVYHMLTTPNAFDLYIDTLDSDGNLVAGLSHNGGATSTTATVYNASSQSILGKTLYCHQFVNIPIFGVGADTTTKTYKGPLVEKLPSSGVKQYIQFNQFAKKIRVRIKSSQAGNMVFHAKLLPMIVGLRNDGVLFSNIKLGNIAPIINVPKILNWIQPTLSSTINGVGWNSVTWSPELGKFVAVAYSGATGSNRVMYSSDGINWIQPTLSSAINSMQWYSVTWSPELGRFVAVAGSGTNRVMYSSDGINWIQPTLSSTINSMGWQSVTWSPELGRYVAVAGSGTNRVMYSSDGINWIQPTLSSTINGMGWRSVTWSPELGRFVAVANYGTGNRVMYSSNGINWIQPTLSSDINGMSWQSVTWSPELGKFVAVAQNGTGTGNRVMYSSDGINWIQPTLSSDINGMSWQSVTWSPELSRFVAVAQSGTGNKVMYSSDGINWIQPTLSSTINGMAWPSVTWSPELSRFVAVAYNGSGNKVMYSVFE